MGNKSYFRYFVLKDVINYRFPTTETNSKALYIFRRFNTTSSVKLFEVTIQISAKSADFCLQLCFSERWKKTHETFQTIFTFSKWKHIFDKNYILDESTFRKQTSFWKWKHVFRKVKVVNHFLKKLQLANSLKKVSRMFVGTKFNWLIISNPEFFPSDS